MSAEPSCVSKISALDIVVMTDQKGVGLIVVFSYIYLLAPTLPMAFFHVFAGAGMLISIKAVKIGRNSLVTVDMIVTSLDSSNAFTFDFPWRESIKSCQDL